MVIKLWLLGTHNIMWFNDTWVHGYDEYALFDHIPRQFELQYNNFVFYN